MFAASDLNEIALKIIKRRLDQVKHHLKMNIECFFVVDGPLFIKNMVNARC